MSSSTVHIEVLHYPEVVRKRVGMYIPDTTSQGLQQLIFQLTKRAVDPKFANDCTSLVLTIHSDDSLSILDNGRGQPIYSYSNFDPRPAVEIFMTHFHFGGDESNVYERCGSLFEFGALINAVCEWLVLETMTSGIKYHMACAKGIITQPLQAVGETNDRGTYLHFKPDDTIWSETSFEVDILTAGLKQLAIEYPGVTFSLLDERKNAIIKFGENNPQDFC